MRVEQDSNRRRFVETQNKVKDNMAKRQLFGTDGIRGLANTYPMTGEVAFNLGRAVTGYFQERTKTQSPLIIIGKDTRLSCYMLEQAFSSGVCAQGGQAILTGPLPTPAVAFITKNMRADAGVMISASHNAFYDNGIKIFNHLGLKLSDETELELEDLCLNPHKIEIKTKGELGNTKRLEEVIGRYIVRVKSCLSEDLDLEGLRVVVDCANGAAYKVGPLIFKELGAEVFSLGVEPNGRNINDQTGALYPKSCQEAVIKYRADLGVCLDGDADRIVLVDETGSIVHGDKLIGVLAKFMLRDKTLKKGDEIVLTHMSNMGLESYLQSLGLKVARTQVGDRYLLERMLESKALLGAEPSGHVILGQYSNTGDGILVALKVLEYLHKSQTGLQEHLKDIELFHQRLTNIKVKHKKPLEDNKTIQKKLKDLEKEYGDQVRILLRYSGTEDLLRLMIEARDAKIEENLSKEWESFLKQELGK